MKNIQLHILGADNFGVQQSFKDLRTNLGFCEIQGSVMAVTSTNKGEGKTVVTMNLAKSMSDLGKKTLIIDADLRDSDMVKYTSLDDASGLCEILSGESTTESLIKSTQYENLHILLAGKTPLNPLELLGKGELANVIAKLRESYDCIVIDTPASSLALDAAVIGSHCDGTIVVADNDLVKYKELRKTIADLQKKNNKIIGIVRNTSKAELSKLEKILF